MREPVFRVITPSENEPGTIRRTGRRDPRRRRTIREIDRRDRDPALGTFNSALAETESSRRVNPKRKAGADIRSLRR